MKITSLEYPRKGEHYNKKLLTETHAGITTTFGTVFLERGTRIPEEGFSQHPFNEVSVIIEGCIEMLNVDGTISGYLNAGTTILINALEPQAGNVLEDTRLIYVLSELSK